MKTDRTCFKRVSLLVFGRRSMNKLQHVCFFSSKSMKMLEMPFSEM